MGCLAYFGHLPVTSGRVPSLQPVSRDEAARSSAEGVLT